MDVRAVITTRPPHRPLCDVPTKYVKRQVRQALDRAFEPLHPVVVISIHERDFEAIVWDIAVVVV